MPGMFHYLSYRYLKLTNLQSIYSPGQSPCLVAPKEPGWTTVESSAFFIRDYNSGNEIIVFGDVEPDSLSLDPRNKRVWEVAAPKVATGTLRAIFIECSYSDSIDDSSLYGHLCPRHLISELLVLAMKVEDIHQKTTTGEKRKRGDTSPKEDSFEMSPKSKRRSTKSRKNSKDDSSSPSQVSTRKASFPALNSPAIQDEQSQRVVDGERDSAEPENQNLNPNSLPLLGLSVYIIHIKDGLTDGPPPGERILEELKTQGEAAKLGCEFRLPVPGEGIWI